MMNRTATSPTDRAALDWTLRLVAAGILTQTLFFKFTAAPESVYIFSTLGMEPWGRIGSGLGELLAATLLLVPATVVAGAGLALGIIAGAIASHLTVLGIEVQGDGGLLFALALVVFGSSLALLVRRRSELMPALSWMRAHAARRPRRLDPSSSGRRG